MLTFLAHHWRILVLRGVLAIAFGVLTFVAPASSLFALVMLFGAYATVDGIFNVVGFFRAPSGQRRWVPFIFEGLAGIGAGVVTFLWPSITALVLVAVIAVWAIITGVAAVVAAVRLRQQIEGEWLLGLNGVLSIGLGILMLLFPGPGALALILWVGAYALLSGVLYLVLGLRLRSRARGADQPIPPLTRPTTA
jgi:uncharacterized membrane protein HdeD (DUF308 family)